MGCVPEKPGGHAKAQRFQGPAATEIASSEKISILHSATQSVALHIPSPRMHVCGACQRRKVHGATTADLLEKKRANPFILFFLTIYEPLFLGVDVDHFHHKFMCGLQKEAPSFTVIYQSVPIILSL